MLECSPEAMKNPWMNNHLGKKLDNVINGSYEAFANVIAQEKLLVYALVHCFHYSRHQWLLILED